MATVTSDLDLEVPIEESHDNDRLAFAQVNPYTCDPIGEEPIPEVDEVEIVHSREQIFAEFEDTSKWCRHPCNRCQVMPTREQNKCCLATPVVNAVVQRAGVSCIAVHPYVDQLLQEGPLELEYQRYLLHYDNMFPAMPTEADQQKKMRFCAYRQMVFWFYPELKKRQRKPLPACLYSKIQAMFPPTTDEELFADYKFSEYVD